MGFDKTNVYLKWEKRNQMTCSFFYLNWPKDKHATTESIVLLPIQLYNQSEKCDLGWPICVYCDFKTGETISTPSTKISITHTEPDFMALFTAYRALWPVYSHKGNGESSLPCCSLCASTMTCVLLKFLAIHTGCANSLPCLKIAIYKDWSYQVTKDHFEGQTLICLLVKLSFKDYYN